jgi:hypothetical protein
VSAAQTSKAAPRKGNQDELPQLPSDELFDAGTSMLFALQDFYLATTELDLIGTVHGDTPSEMMIQMMQHLLNENKFLQRGCSPLQKFKNNRNKAVRVAAQGSIAGAQEIIKTNDDLLQVLRKTSQVPTDEWNFKIAQAASSKGEGYTMIAKAAPWVTVAMFRFVEDEQKHGPIQYFVTAKQRKTLLQEVERTFGKEIEKDATAKDKNWILFAAMLFRRNLMYDTYEEWRKDDQENTNH